MWLGFREGLFEAPRGTRDAVVGFAGACLLAMLQLALASLVDQRTTLVLGAVVSGALFAGLMALASSRARRGDRERKERLLFAGRMATQLAHDLRTPLAALRGALEVLAVPQERGEDVDDDLLGLAQEQETRIASAQAAADLVSVNVAAIPTDLVESTLFGHVRGAFSGAERAKPGAATRAHGGTLFLDEVGDASAAAQAKLLRFVETGSYRPVGDVDERHSDVRLVSATHRPLEEWAESGAFRRDLFHRLRVVELRMPPLRERPRDVPLLLRAFVKDAAAQVDRRAPSVEAILAPLVSHRWPGNVRELAGGAERIVLLPDGPSAADVTMLLRGAPEGAARDLDSHVREAERRAIEDALARTGGNKSEAARLLGISRRSLYDKIAAFEGE